MRGTIQLCGHASRTKIEDLTHFNNNRDTLMNEEFVSTGNTCSRM